jgi:hypothetical protein
MLTTAPEDGTPASCEVLTRTAPTQQACRRPTGAVWAPHDGDDTRLRLIDLATWPPPAASAARLARAGKRAAQARDLPLATPWSAHRGD